MFVYKENCTGCGACVQSCPTKCLSLECDNDGFLMPEVDSSKCIDCNLCEKVCHLNHDRKASCTIQKAYAAVHCSQKVLYDSTSGGLFSAIADYVLGLGGVVYGCAYTGHLKVSHICITKREEMIQLNGSKYVQSDLGDTYQCAKNDLLNGRMVLFSGTPCQIAGLEMFLREKYDRLLTVDIVCHGVASQSVFDKYILDFEERNNIRLSDYNFRSKENHGWSLSGICHGVEQKNGKKIKKKVYYYNEYYYYYFLKGSIYRKGCYECHYANSSRQGDYSLGDLWGAERLKLPFSVEKGCSLLLCNTKAAFDILPHLNIQMTEIPIQEAQKNNVQLVQPTKKPISYEDMVNKCNKWDAKDIRRDFLKNIRIKRFKAFLKYHIPSRIKNYLIKVNYK